MSRFSTRLLMACAAIGVAGGVLFTTHAIIGGLTVNTIPYLYGLTMGLYFLPGTLSQALFRRPGVGLLTSALAGLVSSPFQPIFFLAFVISVGVGLVQELPFAATRYRNWGPWPFWIGALLQGLLVSGAAFGILRGQDLGTAGAILLVACFFVSPFVFTAIARRLATALDRAGVARGLRAGDET